MSKTPAQRAKLHGARAASPAPAAGVENWHNRREQRSSGGLITIAAVVASAFLFWYYHLLTLQQMRQLSNGRAMPDSMILGFGSEYIAALKNVLSSDALGQLQFVHKTAGTLFPVVFSFSALLLIGVCTRRGALRYGLFAPPVLFAVVQIISNVVIDQTLGNRQLDSGQVNAASTLVILSWSLLLLCLISAVVALVWGRKSKSHRSPSAPARTSAGAPPAAGSHP